MKSTISKEIEESGESYINETAIYSVNNDHVDCTIVVNEVLDENQEVIDLLIAINNKGVTDRVTTKCNEQNTQENLIEKQATKINQNKSPWSYLILSMMTILNICIKMTS